jgi:hypothetical protein
MGQQLDSTCAASPAVAPHPDMAVGVPRRHAVAVQVEI